MIIKKNIKKLDENIKISTKSVFFIESFIQNEVKELVYQLSIHHKNKYISKNDILKILENKGINLII